MTKTVFLPGAGGSADFWRPVSRCLNLGDDAVHIGWPGFGDEPPRTDIGRLTDLTRYVLEGTEGPFHLVAQSMGGVVAILTALEAPQRVRSLVLCATSGGIDFGDVPREDWRPDYLQAMPPATPHWFIDDRTNVTACLARLTLPVLLIWGAADRIVPPAAGRRLERLVPDASLVIIAYSGHDVAQTHPQAVAQAISTFRTAGADVTAGRYDE